MSETLKNRHYLSLVWVFPTQQWQWTNTKFLVTSLHLFILHSMGIDHGCIRLNWKGRALISKWRACEPADLKWARFEDGGATRLPLMARHYSDTRMASFTRDETHLSWLNQHLIFIKLFLNLLSKKIWMWQLSHWVWGLKPALSIPIGSNSCACSLRPFKENLIKLFCSFWELRDSHLN